MMKMIRVSAYIAMRSPEQEVKLTTHKLKLHDQRGSKVLNKVASTKKEKKV